MIVARGLGKVSAGNIVAFGLGIRTSIVLPPPVTRPYRPIGLLMPAPRRGQIDEIEALLITGLL